MKHYSPHITSSVNRKGVLDIDSVKGCSFGMSAYPKGGCYGLCYAAKIAKLYNYDFTNSVSREINDFRQLLLFNGFISGPKDVFNMVAGHGMEWFRIGTMGDPCHDWDLTLKVCKWLCNIKTPVVITKHWVKITDNILGEFEKSNVVFNTSISPLDTEPEINHRLAQFNRIKNAGIKSVLRIVSCKFGNTEKGNELNKIQDELFDNSPVIDNPLRIPKTDSRVVCGDILTEKHSDLGGGSNISIRNKKTYIGHCSECPDQCGTAE